MKLTIISLLSAAAFVLSASADTSAKITGVHLCCKSCVTGVEKALDKAPGVKAQIDAETSTVTLNGADNATVQRGADALVHAGYFGTSENPEIKMNASTGALGRKVSSVKVENVHLCCGKCVKAAQKAVHSVRGVKEDDCTKNAKSFEVKGNFDEKAVFTALQKEGLNGKVGK